MKHGAQSPGMILASASPRRKELLGTLKMPFAVVKPDIEEKKLPHESATQYVKRNAFEKAERVAADHPTSIVIAADTIVVLGSDILEKPADAKEAEQMLLRLSGTEHLVFTGLCVVRSEPVLTRQLIHVESRIRFRKLSLEEIRNYVHTGESLDKAGAYGAQGEAAKFIESVSGSFTNVVGLPMDELTAILAANFGIHFA
jgi:septum formation protein